MPVPEAPTEVNTAASSAPERASDIDRDTTGSGPSVRDIGQQRDVKGACAPCPDLEGCYTSPNQMQHFADQVINLIVEWADYQYEAMPGPARWLYIPTGVTGEMACVDGVGSPAQYNDMSYACCPADQTVYLGEQALWYYYIQAGDAGAAVGIAHEFGHHIQRVIQVEQLVDMSDQVFIILKENQADCIAGDWFGHQVDQGRTSHNDLDDIGRIITMIADLENDPNREHGTLDERASSFIDGMRDGLRTCNAFFPNTPVITFG